MKDHNAEKRALEKTAIELFLSRYNKLKNKKYKLLRQQEIPDTVIIDEKGAELGVEITHLFYDALEAKMLLGRSNRLFHEVEKFSKLVDELNMLIEKKIEKGPSYIEKFQCLLLIRNASPVSVLSDFKENIEHIKISKKIFKEIWLLTRNDISYEWELLRLDG